MSEPLSATRELVEQHAEERRQLFVTGFVRFVINKGHKAVAPTFDAKGRPESWQAVGRRLYGADLFNQVMQREIAARKEPCDAGSGLPDV